MDKSEPVLPITANALDDDYDKEAGRGPSIALLAALVVCALLSSATFGIASLAPLVTGVAILAILATFIVACMAPTTSGFAKFLAAYCASVAFAAIGKGLADPSIVNQTTEGGEWAETSKEPIEAEDFDTASKFFGAFGTASEVVFVCAMVANLISVMFMCLFAFKR